MALGGAHPAFVRQNHGNGIIGNQIVLTERPGLFTRNNRRAAIVSVSFGIGLQLALDQLAQTIFRTENSLEFIPLCGQLVLLAANFHFLKLGQVP